MKTIASFSIFLIIWTNTLYASRVLEVCSSCTITSIKEGIAQARKGDVIRIDEGIYKEGHIVIDKPLTLLGINFPVLDGEGKTEILTVIANDVTIEGLTIQNVGTSYLEDRAAIRIRKSKRFTILNNRLYNSFFGIYIENSSDGLIKDNLVVGEAVEEMSSGNAIHLWYCKNIRIENNKVSQHRDGIYFEFVDDSEIKNNLSENNLRYGLHFMFSNNDNYYRNTFRNNGAGVAVMFSKIINMWENRFEHNWGKSSYGLLLKEIYDAEIHHNEFVENTIGIYVEGSTRINYYRNEFIHNGWALKISGGCVENVVTKNNFIANTFDLAVSQNINENKFDENYWSEYNGYDTDRDGKGDIPYRPVKLFNYIVNKTPEALVLLRSLFVDIINFSEKVSPVFTPKNVLDNTPLMKSLDNTR